MIRPPASRSTADSLPVGHRAGEQVGGPDEAGDEHARRLPVDLLGGADLLDPAAAHHGDPVAHRERLVLVVGDEDEGDPDLALDSLEFELHRLAQLEVERRQRLVEQERARHVDQRTGECDALLLATRQLIRASAGELSQLHDVEHFLGAPDGVRFVDLLGAQAERHVVEHRHVREQGVLLEHGVDVALMRRHIGDVAALEQNATTRRLFEAGDHLEQRRLAAARRSEQREELASPNREIGSLDGDERAEFLAHGVEDDDVVGLRRVPHWDASVVRLVRAHRLAVEKHWHPVDGYANFCPPSVLVRDNL